MPVVKSTNSPYSDLLTQIDLYPSLDEWYQERIAKPTLKRIVPQFISLLLLNAGIVYIGDWLAAFICFSFIILLAYNTLISNATILIHAILLMQIRSSYIAGLNDGKNKIE